MCLTNIFRMPPHPIPLPRGGEGDLEETIPPCPSGTPQEGNLCRYYLDVCFSNRMTEKTYFNTILPCTKVIQLCQIIR